MKKQSGSSRRTFIKTSMLAGLGMGIGTQGLFRPNAAGATDPAPAKSAATRPRPAGQKPVFDLTTKPVDKVRVGIIGLGQRGSSLVRDLLAIDFVELAAVCDIRQERVDAILKKARDARGLAPKSHAGDENAWEKLVAQDDLDVVYVATPWDWHVPMCVKAMLSGKHAFVEVTPALTIDECWRLVDVSEKTQRHCSILENCCYGENELFVLNMVRKGVFGTLTHAECAYIHDLRGMLFKLGTEGDWRREYHKTLDGNLYPTHGLGPVCQYMDIGRGDNMKFLVSVSSPETGLSQYLRDKNPNNGRHAGEKYLCGDMNTSIIKTELGRTIMVQHDVISPRPYSRINALCGAGATFFDYPARLAIDNPSAHGLAAKGSHEWLGDADMLLMRDKFTHPLHSQLRKRAKASGHGGMDYVMNHRLLDCIRKGLTPDTTVYDAAAWSAIIELSCRSVEAGSLPVAVPDFTRGAWKKIPPLGIATA